ncbi:MAG: hypothetical protein WA885_22745 [Phormidesmis sp.]
MKSVLIYTTHKSASMFLHKLAANLAAELGIDAYSINNSQHFDLIKDLSWKAFIEDPARNGCFGPIRGGETELIFPDDLSEYSVILHLRDPRDALTSLFFSHVYSHPERKGGFNPGDSARKQWEEIGIDDYVIDRTPKVKRRYHLLIDNLIKHENVRLLKYSDMVLNYPVWLDEFLAAFSHFDVPSRQLLKLVSTPNSLSSIHRRLVKKYQNEFAPPKKEDVFQHRRQIIPGDYKRKLKASTIEKLNNEFHDVLEVLNLAQETKPAGVSSD